MRSDVTHMQWGAGPVGGPLNPMHPHEIQALAAKLRHDLGAEIADIRCGPSCLTATIALARPAHPTLCAAVRRFMAGCPVHHSRRCGLPHHHGGHDCRCFSAGQRGVFWPSTPGFAQHQSAIRPTTVAAVD